MRIEDQAGDRATQRLLRDAGFEELKAWIIATTGLSYYADKDRDLAGAVMRCEPLRELPAAEMLHLLQRRQGTMLDRLVEELTIGETFFFRHGEMFQALREQVLPDLIRQRSGLRSLRIWSAGCSVGAEPYSLAILLRDVLGADAVNWTCEIIATDINRRFLALARAGVYDRWALRGMDPVQLQRVFHRVGERWRLNEVYREMVTFRHHNLVRNAFPSLEHGLSGLDLVICRNVIIYFDAATNRRLVDQFFRSLMPGGWLAVGHAEPHTELFQAFETVNAPGAVLYRKAADDRPARALPSWPVTTAREEWSWSQRIPALVPPAVATRGVVPSVPGLEEIQPPDRGSGIEEIVALADGGDLQAARAAAEKLTASEPLHVGAHFHLGLVLFQTGDWDRSRRALKRALYLHRELVVAHYYLGLVELSMGEEAARSFQNARRLVQRLPDDLVLPWGEGLTAAELKVLLAPYVELPHQPV